MNPPTTQHRLRVTALALTGLAVLAASAGCSPLTAGNSVGTKTTTNTRTYADAAVSGGSAINKNSHAGPVVTVSKPTTARVTAPRAPVVPAAPTSSSYPATSGTVYYVNPNGSDANSGRSASAPFQTIAKVNKLTLRPGDRVLFARGGAFGGTLRPAGSGTAGKPILLGAYGTGDLPKLTSPTGNCVRVDGNYVTVDSLSTTNCSYAGFAINGDHNSVTNSRAANLIVGIHIARGSSYGRYERNVLTDINRMLVNTRGTNCGTSAGQRCSDDSGATAVLINGDDNDIGYNTVTGSIAASYDYGHDGSAFEIYDANRNVIHDNVSINNLVLSELGRSSSGTANGNTYRANRVVATCGGACTSAGGITLRGNGSGYGPNANTTITGNSFNLVGSDTKGIVCNANCPSTTSVTGNTFYAASRAFWFDGAGWTLRGNTVNGQTVAQAGTQKVVVQPGTAIAW